MPDDEVLISAQNVSKKFCRSLKRSLWYGVKDISSEMLGLNNKTLQLRKDEFWALKEISFELRRGECLGLIGHNGAGKSTLLKILNGLIKPDTGKITMKGRVGALIELGAGFNPILTGRENVYVNGQILGFTKKEIDHKFDEIVEFAEIGEFIDTPVQNYSSGMKVRLGFAVAAQMEPDVLIIDEVLAVGDLGFRGKCMTRVTELLKTSGVIFVSHVMPIVNRYCNRCIYLEHGRNEIDGATNHVIEYYHNYFKSESGGSYIQPGNELISFRCNGKEIIHDQSTEIFYNTWPIFDLKFRLASVDKPYRVKINILNRDLQIVATLASPETDNFVSKSKINSLQLKFGPLILKPGDYKISLNISDQDFRASYMYFEAWFGFKVVGIENDFSANFIVFENSWQKM